MAAEWKNIFDLGDWDVYVQYVGVTSEISPDSRNYLVRAADLDPNIGTVTVNGSGEIVCSFEPPSGGGGGNTPAIVVMPVGGGISSQARLTCAGVVGLDESVVESYFSDVESITSEGEDIWSYNDGINFTNYASPADWDAQTELPEPLASGNGLLFYRDESGV